MSFAAASLSEALPHDQLLRRRIPAWLLSLTLHLTAVLVGSLLVRGTQLPAVGEESARPAAIVLAHRTESTKTNYFTPEDLQKGESEAAAATSPSSSSEFTGSLPTAAESPPPSTVARLPELPGHLARSGETIVLKPQSSGNKGRLISHLTEADKAAILAEDAARPRVRGPTGPAAKVSLFGSHEAEGHSFVFLLDRSQSMGGDGLGAIEAASKELATSVAAL
ncbi:MAG: hypothetical protein K8R36_15965, partial [Planctomycetales bacterium]|nr:hypothetical protein [Planctomycetales bacterium]